MTDPSIEPEKAVREKRKSRVGSLGLLLVVAVAGLLGWTAWKLWDDMNADDASRRLRDGFNLLHSNDTNERSGAAAMLQFAYKPKDIDAALDALSRTMGDRDWQVRLVTAQSIGGLIVRIKDPKTDTVATPEQVQRWTDRAAQELVKRLSDPDDKVRTGVITGVMMITRQPQTAPAGEPPDLPPAPKASGKRGGRGRGKAEPRRPPADLAKALKNGTTSWSRDTAKAYYGYTERIAPPALVAALKDESSDVRLAAIRALNNFPLGVDAALPALLDLLDKGEPLEHEVCRDTLRVAWPAADAVSSLTEAVENAKGEARLAAVVLLERIGPDASPAAPALVAAYAKWLDSKGEAADGRVMAKALARIAPGSAAEQERRQGLDPRAWFGRCADPDARGGVAGEIRQGRRGGLAQAARARRSGTHGPRSSPRRRRRPRGDRGAGGPQSRARREQKRLRHD